MVVYALKTLYMVTIQRNTEVVNILTSNHIVPIDPLFLTTDTMNTLFCGEPKQLSCHHHKKHITNHIKQKHLHPTQRI